MQVVCWQITPDLPNLVTDPHNTHHDTPREGRGHWTKTKAICRNLAVTIKAHIEPHSPESSKYFLELLAAWPMCLMHLSLGGAARLSDHAQTFLPAPADPDQYHDSPALPAMLLAQRLHQTVHQAAAESRTSKSNLVEALHLAEVSHLVDSLMDSMSSCEKILRTPVPWTYSRHTSRFLTLWMGTLPFALVGSLSPGLTLAVVVAASYCMFGIEEIGHLIEQPFSPDNARDEQIWSKMDEDGEASALITRGQKTQPYDIGIPVCSLAVQIRNDVLAMAASGGSGSH
jgi:predicted membrane chloride channel (bestrophin family)